MERDRDDHDSSPARRLASVVAAVGVAFLFWFGLVGVCAEPVEEDEPVQAYTVFDVLRPAEQETLWNIGAVLDVSVDLQPGLQPGHHLGVYLDGQLSDVGATTTQFQLPDVFRGMHTLQAVVLDDSGTEVLRSLAVNFMVQQTSILNPANPLAR